MQAASAIPALTLLLADPSGWVRGAAADALALIGEPAVPALGEALQDPREGVRVRAAYALRRIKSVKSARWLFPALNDSQPHRPHLRLRDAGRDGAVEHRVGDVAGQSSTPVWRLLTVPLSLPTVSAGSSLRKAGASI
jgi:HEAT repeat protein